MTEIYSNLSGEFDGQVGMPSSPARTKSGRQRSTSRPNTAEALTPVPDYMGPLTRSSARKFRKLHEDHMMDKLLQKRSAKKERNIQTRDLARDLARKIPMEMLAKDWYKDDEETAETRCFLVDKVMPTLIMGVEKLLIEAEKKGLAETNESDPNFNPINFLAQYLMRNNPRYSNFGEASPYVRSLRSVGEELRKQLFDLEENRLAKIKSEAKRKREQREHEEMLQTMEKKRRADALATQFAEWEDTESTRGIEPRLNLALLQNALRSFADVAEQLPEPLKDMAKFSHELDPTDDTGRTVGKEEFALYIDQYVDEMPSEVFDQLIRHLSSCASSHKSKSDKERRQIVLEKVFLTCDRTGVGLLDRKRMLSLYDMFYDKAEPEVKESLRNPKKWPVIDVEEIDSYPDSEDEAEPVKLIDNNVDKTQDADQKNLEEGETESKTETKVEESADVTSTKEDSAVEVKESNAEEGQTDDKEKEVSEEKQTAEDSEQAKEESGEVVEEAIVGQNQEETEMEPVIMEEPSKELLEQEEGEKKDLESSKESENAGDSKENVSVAPDATGQKDDAEVVSLKSSGKPPLTQQSKVSFAEGTAFEREKTLLTGSGGRSQSQASAFDENTLNCSQFIQITETFLGDDPSMDIFQNLVRYLKDGYVETEDERLGRLMKAREGAQSAKRKAVLNSIFDMWDNEGSGYLDLDEVLLVMRKYKAGVDNYAIDAAKKKLKTNSKYHDFRLSKREFRDFVYQVVEEMGGGENFEQFIEYLLSSIERSYQERVRGEARKKWLQQIINAAETSAAQMEPVYKVVFQSLYKDADAHGQGKVISAYIAMLEKNEVAPQRGDFLLRNVAATLDHSDKILGKALFKDMKGISFASVETGKPIHVPRVTSHGNIHFWDPQKLDEDNEGSFIIVPLKDRNKRVFGTLGIDTLNDPQPRSIFITHEIQYFQGIAKAFSIAYHHVDIRQKTMRISESAISWIHRRSPSINEITVYMVEPDGKSQDYVLRRMMVTDEKGMAQLKTKPDKLERKDNLFRDYLFKCVDNSESVTADAYGERHLAIPLRDNEGRAIVVVDISIGDLKALPRVESKEVMKMLKLLQLAYKEISKDPEEKSSVLEDGQSLDDDSTEILFDRLMLMELKDNVSKLDAQAYAEMKSYKEPPPVVQQIIKAVLGIFHTDLARSGEFDNWDKCKRYVNPSLSSKIMAFDPTASMADSVPVELINTYLSEVPHGAVSKHGSTPAQFLYNWVFVCVSLIEHTRKMQSSKKQIVDEMGEQAQEQQPSQQQVKADGSEEKVEDEAAAGSSGSAEKKEDADASPKVQAETSDASVA